MIVYIDFVKQWQRVPRTLRRLQCLQDALGEPVELYLANDHVGEPDELAISIGGPDSDYGIKTRAKGLLPQAVARMRGLKKNDVFICRGAKIAKRLRGAGATVPKCLRVLYVHDDPFPTSVADNDSATGWLKPHIIFALQPGRLDHYRKRVPHAEWAYYGVDTEMFYPRDVLTKYDVVIGSHVPSKIYNIRFEWMKALNEKCNARIADRLTYAEYIEMLSSSRICVDIPNTRQMGKGGAWSWQVAYRAFEILALGRPALLPDLPGYRKAFNDTAFFYKPNYDGFARSVRKLLKKPGARDIRIPAGLRDVREKYSLEAVTKREAKVIRSML